MRPPAGTAVAAPELPDGLYSGPCEHALFADIAARAAAVGYPYCGYTMRIPVPISRPLLLSLSTFGADWEASAEGVALAQAGIAHARTANRALPLWDDPVFAGLGPACAAARSHGLCQGWAQPSRDARGVVSLLTLLRPGRADGAARGHPGITLGWLIEEAHQRMSELLLARHAPEVRQHITLREREILRWTADGKTAYEIGRILLISENTVAFHIKNVVSKLRASNKVQAAVKASALGLL
ncbi:autoinducer binding domain-containing protein [Oxalobacteraceae bacterium]|nr:autoinducer binding domain-containing protein [Oxalobacteraceae bacterium]